ncbi:hypothetical protein C7S20_19150 [Christiangramia fulva]|uniref:DUF7793 domain-containing protein n=1 Tax=Christiangramia fulva TaxID=2126553 RepID=A0A2R3ZA94_9FLAO|nr:hypothetical protein [Christiangramia fulva]AVR47196.1 hypothetical protein C7S20_19150 [Christiangramia fulva]
MGKTGYGNNQVADIHIDNGILHFVYKPNTILNLKNATAAVNQRLAVQKDRAYPIFCDVRGLVSSDKEGRDYLAKQGSVLVKAVGILASDPLTNRIISFYMNNSKPRIPTKVFSQRFAALSFLEKFTGSK